MKSEFAGHRLHPDLEPAGVKRLGELDVPDSRPHESIDLRRRIIARQRPDGQQCPRRVVAVRDAPRLVAPAPGPTGGPGVWVNVLRLLIEQPGKQFGAAVKGLKITG